MAETPFFFLMRPEEWKWWRRMFPNETRDHGGTGWATTGTAYEWCEVCARNVADDPQHTDRHEALAPQNRAQRRAIKFGKPRKAK